MHMQNQETKFIWLKGFSHFNCTCSSITSTWPIAHLQPTMVWQYQLPQENLTLLFCVHPVIDSKGLHACIQFPYHWRLVQLEQSTYMPRSRLVLRT